MCSMGEVSGAISWLGTEQRAIKLLSREKHVPCWRWTEVS